MLAEIRAYGEGLVIAEQIPSKLVSDVVKNTALKVMHRLPAADDRDLVGAAMNLDDGQSRQVVSLEPGVAAVFADGMDRPIRIRVPFGGAAECPGPGPVPPLLARRSTACGPRCTGERACTAGEMRAAEVLAAAGSPADAWLRVWVQALVLAFLTDRGLPAVPAPLRGRWDGLGGRLRECLLATVVDQAVAVRARALRPSYDPAHLAASVARAALAAPWPRAPGRVPGPARAGSSRRCAGCTRRTGSARPAAGRPIPAGARRRSISACPASRTGRAHGWGTGCGPCGAIRCPWTCRETGWPPGPPCSARTTSAASATTWPPLASGCPPVPSSRTSPRRWASRPGWPWCCPGPAGSWLRRTIRRPGSRVTRHGRNPG